MCGFAIYIGKRARTNTQKERTIRGLQRRGPDSTACKEIEANGLYCFMAHSRLAIIDGKNEGAGQPFRVSDYGWLLFNGEIYNYKEIRSIQAKRGHTHLTESDTEVLANAVADGGLDTIRELHGMWSYVCVSDNLQEVTYSRDVFGEKPLFIKEESDGIFLGSTPKQILDLMNDGERSIDEESVRRYLYMGHRGYYNEGCSPWKGIRAVKPNRRISRTESGVRVEVLLDTEYSSEDPVAEQKERIRNCAIRQLRNSFNTDSDVKSALLLSGGLDSNLLAGAWLATKSDDLTAYTAKTTDKRYDESEIVDTIVKKNIRIDHRYVLTDGKKSFQDVIEIVQSTADFLPSATSVALASVISQAAQDGIKVIHMGCGGDEVFGGYLVHHLFFLKTIENTDRYDEEYAMWKEVIKPGIRNQELRDPIEFASRYKSGAWLDTTEEERFFKRTDLFREYKRGFEKGIEARDSDLLKVALNHDLFSGSIPSQLAAADYIGMHYGIENRSGLLSRELFQEVRKIKSSFYYSKAKSKAIMRECLGDLIDKDVLDSKDKVGFNIDFRDFCSGAQLNKMLKGSKNRRIIEEAIDVNALLSLLEKESVSNGVSRLAFRVAVVAAFEP